MPATSDMHVVFRLSGIRLALPADCMAEMVLEPRLTRPPTAPPVVAGVMDLRGSLIPVIRLDRLLDLPPPARTPFRPVLVLSRPPPAPWAVLVEAVEEVLGPEFPRVAAPSDLAFDDCVLGMLVLPGGPVPVLAPERLLRKREAMALEDFRDRAAARLEEFSLAQP
ncbi:MAG: chemotaxis protein CheW [Rhodospirillaceae bacterium]|nr:chemotaxis protein CheW [Rhodospirillales bacterium]